MSNKKKTFSELLKNLRGEKTYREIEELTGISYGSYWNWETTGKVPREFYLRQIADGFKVPRSRVFQAAGLGEGGEEDQKWDQEHPDYFTEADRQRLENRTIVFGRKETVEGGITQGILTPTEFIVSGERGEGLENAPMGLFALEVSSDQWSPLVQGRMYPALRWDGKEVREGDVLLFKTSEGYEAKVYSQEAGTEGLDENTTFVVWTDRAF